MEEINETVNKNELRGGGSQKLVILRLIDKMLKSNYNSGMMNYSYRDYMKRGFTLSEVLITLAIIGVVAALTIPTISSNIQNAALKNQFKKFYSTFLRAVQGIQTIEARPVRCHYWTSLPYKCTVTCKDEDKNEYGNCLGNLLCAETGEAVPDDINGPRTDCSWFFDELFNKTLKIAKKCEDHAYDNGCLPKDIKGLDKVQLEHYPDSNPNPDGDFSDNKIKNNYAVYVLQDGSYIILYGKSHPLFAFDINGQKGPNKWGYDIFAVTLRGSENNGIETFKNYSSYVEKGGKKFEEMLEETGLK